MIVLDCNAAIAMNTNSETGEALRALMVPNEEAIAPSVYINETTNAFAKYIKGNLMSQEEALRNARKTLALVDEYYDDTELWEEALAESVRLKHPAYDMFYLVLARRRAATLITLDQKLQELCLECGVNCLYTINDF